MRKILGISAFYHDSAAALVVGGEIIAAAQEERFTREKHTPKFPLNAIKFCLEEGGFALDELDAVVFYDKPLLKFERLLETYYAFAPKGLISFLKAMPTWLKEKMFLKNMIYKGLGQVETYDRKALNLLFSEHHLSHAASAFFPSRFKDSAILTIDGVGEWCTASIGKGSENTIKIIKELHFPHSVGLLYSAFTYYLGFKVNSGEYKLMGLAPYGNVDSPQTNDFVSKIKEYLVCINDDGSIWLNQDYFNYSTGLRMVKDKKWHNLFGMTRREPEMGIEQNHCDLALAIQTVTEEIVLKMASETKKITNSKNLCLAGGVALNCVANGKLQQAGIFENIYIQPAAGDAGGALGAALATNYIFYENERVVSQDYDSMKGSYLGPEYSNKEIELMNRKEKAVCNNYLDFEKMTTIIAEAISEGKVVGWFQGRMEFGPRALGNRSILGDPRNPDMQKKMNLKIKYREGFRPFAPSVLEEDTKDYFDIASTSPYMLLVAPINKDRRSTLPENYQDLTIKNKLSYKRSDIQPVTHIDFSARVQTISKKTNPKYWKLVQKFKELTGYGLMVNTSFNVRGEPIVMDPFSAYRCFMSTEMDILVINNYVYLKTSQPNPVGSKKWQVNFEKD